MRHDASELVGDGCFANHACEPKRRMAALFAPGENPPPSSVGELFRQKVICAVILNTLGLRFGGPDGYRPFAAEVTNKYPASPCAAAQTAPAAGLSAPEPRA